MVKDEAFLDLEASLIAELLPRWNSLNKRLVSRLAKAISGDDLSEVTTILESLKAETLYRGKIKKIKILFRTGLFFGASRVTGTAKGLYIADNKDELGMSVIAEKQFRLQLDAMIITVRKNLTSKAVTIRERLDWEKQNADNYHTDKSEKISIKKVNPINVVDALSVSSSSIGKNMINIASSLQMSRMAGYGFAAEATARGVTSYRINEQLDGKTCPVCRRMHNKVFQVKDAYSKLDTLIRVTDPNDIKLLAPWPKQDKASLIELDEMTSEQLRAKGYDTPPFHPRCRGLLAVDPKEQKLTNIRPASLIEGILPTKPVNTRVAEFLESAVGQNLSEAERSAIIAASIGVEDYTLIPDSIKKMVEGK